MTRRPIRVKIPFDMNIYKVLPDLSKTRHMGIWHKALRSQWSAADLDWDRPQRIKSRRLKDQMARILTPVLMGEQAALYSVSGLIPVLGHRSEVESQFYLTTWAVDEARRHQPPQRAWRHSSDRDGAIRITDKDQGATLINLGRPPEARSHS